MAENFSKSKLKLSAGAKRLALGFLRGIRRTGNNFMPVWYTLK